MSEKAVTGPEFSIYSSITEEILESFLPYFPENERDLLAGGRKIHGSPGEVPFRADTAAGNMSGPNDVYLLLIREIITRLREGPVPLPLLTTIARRCDFQGLTLIEAAAASAGSGDAQVDAFDASDPVEAGSDARFMQGEGVCDEDCVPGAGSKTLEYLRSTGYTGAPAVDSLEAVFDSVFRVLGEEREGQLEMARTVMTAFCGGGLALIEAPTGTGKSMAYLVPAVLYSLETGERVVVSTYTRNLQDQLYGKEVPLLETVLDVGVSMEQLMGRENYICSRKVFAGVTDRMDSDPEGALELALTVAMSGRGEVDGLCVSSCPESASVLAAPAHCSMRKCGYADRCYLLKARIRAREAKVVFVNHALLLTDYRQNGAVLGQYGAAVLDEAHHLEHCVIENLSIKVERGDVDRILEPLDPSAGAVERLKFLIGAIEAGGRSVRHIDPPEKLIQRSRSLQGSFNRLFVTIASALNPDRDIRDRKTRYRDGGEAFADCTDSVNDYWLLCNGLCRSLEPLLESDVSAAASDCQQDLVLMRDELVELSEGLRFLTEADNDDFVFWLEWTGGGALRRICGSPLSVDRLFADYLENRCASAILTSATLARMGSFEYISDRLGLGLGDFEPEELVASSPFDHDKRCLIEVFTKLGDPNAPDYAVDVSRIVADLAEALGRKMMVLFTSYSLCHSTADLMAARLPSDRILVQGRGESREVLSRRFRGLDFGVLMGVASFWEGIDFPGEELEVLVIPKIPFPVPTEPVVEALAERIRGMGENPFEKLFLPRAIMRLRQGIGRLIRRKEDRGIVVLLDSRLDSRPYGETVLSSLPSQISRVESEEGLISGSFSWFMTG